MSADWLRRDDGTGVDGSDGVGVDASEMRPFDGVTVPLTFLLNFVRFAFGAAAAWLRRFREPFVAIKRIGEPAFGETISGEPLLLYAESSDEPFDMRRRAIVFVVVFTIREVILFCNARRSRALGFVGSVLSPTDTTSISSSTETEKWNETEKREINNFIILFWFVGR